MPHLAERATWNGAFEAFPTGAKVSLQSKNLRLWDRMSSNHFITGRKFAARRDG